MALIRRVFATVAVATLGLGAVGVLAAPAEAADNPDLLTPCHFASFLDPTAEPETQAGVMEGQAVLPVGVSTRPGSLACSIHVGLGQGTHTGSRGPQTNGAYSSLVMVSGPSFISYHATQADPVYICSQITFSDDGSTIYWDSALDQWSSSSAVSCALGLELLGQVRGI